MTWKFWKWRRSQPKHKHNFEMEFKDNSFDWVFRCACGETAANTHEALKKMRLS